jgi:hypothetical protein
MAPHIHSSKTDHARVTIMERLDQGNLHPKLDVLRLDMFRLGIEPGPLREGEHSSKELFEQRVNSYS